MIVYIGVMLFIAGLLVGDGFNIILPTFAKAGLNIQFMLKVVTLAQTIALIYGFFAIFIIRKIGPRIMSTVSMIIIGVMDARGVGVNRNGAFAEYLVIPEENVWKCSKSIPEELYSIFDPFGNATHAALTYDVIGEDVLISGAGPIGCMNFEGTLILAHPICWPWQQA